MIMSRFSSVGRALDCNGNNCGNPQVAGSIPAIEIGGVAQMEERSLSVREVLGSTPSISIILS